MRSSQKKSFEREIARLKRENAELAKVAADAESYMQENRILHSENQMAARIQNSMLPKRGLLDSGEHFQVYADVDFAREVGGDYYDYFEIDDKRVCLSVGDVSGKGVPAIIYMVAAKLLLKNELQGGRSLSESYEKVNRELFQLAGERQFVTSFSLILDTDTGSIEFVNAGHTPTLIMRQNGHAELIKQLSGLPLGSYYSSKKAKLMKYQAYQAELNPGDMIVVYTDGCSEAGNGEGELLGIERFIQMFRDCHDMPVFEDKIRYVQRQIITFEDHEEQDDDYTIAAIAWR